MRSFKWSCFSLWLILSCLSQVSVAQVTYAALHGTVTDSSGAVIPNAAVTVLNTSTGIQTVQRADKSGYYSIPQLQIGGPYSVTISSPGFQNFVATGLMLNVNDNREVNGKLKVGAASQTVEVSATALQVETSSTQLSQVATAEQLEEIPLEGRDPAGMQKLEPGVVESSDRFGSYSSNGSQTAQNSYMLNGADINDGPLQDEGIAVNPDALSEENIVTSTMNPEFARNSGAVINQVIKSGSNSFHGSGFEFYRDTFLNNGDYFSQTRPVFHQNLYGGTLGGPIIKNKVFFFAAYQGQRNRTSVSTLQQTMDSTQLSGDFTADTNYGLSAPNSAGLTDNPLPFAIGSCPAGEAWNACFAPDVSGNTTVVIPPTLWNPVASKLISSYVPLSNETVGGIAYYNFNALSTRNADQGVLRLDYTPSKSDSLWASSVFQSRPGGDELPFGGSSFPGAGQIQAEHYKIFSASWTHTFNANMLNELHGGYFRFNFAAVIPAQNIPPSSVGFTINPQLSQSGLPYMSIGQYFNLGFSFEGPQPRLDTNLTYADTFSWVKGNHSLKFGGSFEQFRVHNPFGLYNNGNYGFDGGGIYSSGDPLLDFAMGIPDSYSQTNDGFIDAVANEIYWFAQDNWKVSPDFTLNFGVGWDAEQPNQNRQYNGLGITCFQVSNTTSTVFPGGPPGLTFPGDPGCNSAGSPTTHYNRFGPRIGFAWSPSSGPSKLFGEAGAHNFSIRGGFGLYYNRDQEEQSLQNLGDPPFLYESRGASDLGAGFSPGFANPFADVAGNGSEANPYPYTPPAAGAAVNWGVYTGLDLAAFSPSYSVPYTMNYNVNIQRAIGGSIVAQIGYVGSVSHRLASWYEGDPITAAGHAACAADVTGCASPGERIFIHPLFPQYTAQPAVSPSGVPWYYSIGTQDTEGASNYNSFQARVVKAPTHGLQLTAGYTYSHALDDGSGYESVTGGDQNYGNYGRVRNYVPGFEYLNYGSSDFDARHRLTLSYVYTVPVAGILKSNLALREALSGWGFGGISAFQSGFPVGISMGTQRSLWCDAYSYFGCPDVPMTSSFNIGLHNPRNSTNQWFDTGSFAAEPVGTFGNTTRNFFRGPGFNYTNLQISKEFPFSSDGKRHLQLRLEAFNAFNHANFAPPSGNFSSSSFGTITSVIHSQDPNADPQPGRAIQIAGKFYFLVEPEEGEQ